MESWASEESRSIDTGKSFLKGLEMDPEGIVVDNSKAHYYKGEFGCERYDQEVSQVVVELKQKSKRLKGESKINFSP